MGDKRIKLSSPAVTQTSSIIEETLYSAITRNHFRKQNQENYFAEMNVDYVEMQITLNLIQ